MRRKKVSDVNEYSVSIFPNESLLDLRLFQFGWEQCAPLHSFGPFVRNHYLFHYIISGRGFLDAAVEDGPARRYDLEAGQGFLICPGQVNTYSADQNQPWKYVWLEFDGLRARGYLSAAGLGTDQPIYRPKNMALAEEMKDIMLYVADHPTASPLHLIGYLCLFLDALIQSSATRQETPGAKLQEFYIQEAVNFMELNYQRELTVEEIASVCRLNRSYFSKLFKEVIGCTPQEFLIALRLNEAAELMKSSNTSIGEIAVRCGYPNQLHFSQAFKKRYGVPPREWRKENKPVKKS